VKNFVLVCLGVLVVMFAAAPAHARQDGEETSPFVMAKCVGEPNARAFYLFSTSLGKYTIRFDGMGEVYIKGRKRLFYLKNGVRGRVSRIYFFEHGEDLLLLYQAGDTGFLVRMDQNTRRPRWTKSVGRNFQPPIMKDGSFVFDDGAVISLSGT
jgi:hypothetical protein